MDQHFIQWQAHEYEHWERSTDWFWAVGIISVSIAAASIIFDNILFAALIIIGAISLTLHAIKKPEILDVEVNVRGVKLNNKLYLYDNLDSFWIDESGRIPKLLIKSKKMIMPLIVIPIGDVDTHEIRIFLAEFIPEEEHMEPLFHKILEYLGF